MEDFELFEVIGTHTLKWIATFPGDIPQDELLRHLNEMPENKPRLVLKNPRIATPEFFEAFFSEEELA